MRFTCPKCGKKYASSAEPAPGKAYRLKCKACGEGIVLRAGGVVSSASAPTPAPVPGGAAVVKARPPPNGSPGAGEPFGFSSPAMMSAARVEPTGAAPAAELEPARPEPGGAPAAPTPPPARAADAGLDLDVALPSGTPAPGSMELPDDSAIDLQRLLGETNPSTPAGPLPERDPFAAAVRGSLPDGYGAGGGAPDPIAALTGEAPPERREPAEPAIAANAAIREPPRQRSGLAIALLAVGLLVLVAILAFAVIRGRGSEPATGQTAPPAAR